MHRARLISLVCLSLAYGEARAQSATPNKWTLDNGVVRKTVGFSNQVGLEATEWTDLASGHDFIAPRAGLPGLNEFQVNVDGKSISGKAADVSLIKSDERTAADGTRCLDLAFRAKSEPVEIVVHYELAKGQPAIRQFLDITNDGARTVMLRHLVVSNGALVPGAEHDLVAYGGYGEDPRETFFTGRVNDVAVLLENAKTGVGFAVLSEVPGYLKRTELGQIGWHQWTPAFSAMYDTDLFPFERTLAPHEAFRTAAVSVLFYRRGTAEDPHWRIPEYVRDRIAHNKGTTSPWIYNTWEPFHKDISAALMRDVIPRAASAGFDLLTLDDGWETLYGDNTVDAGKFPQGLEPVFTQATALGMKRGLWSPLALIDMKSQVFREHPEWACREADGSLRYSNASGVVMSLASPYRQAAAERIAELVDRYKLDYVKLDLTTVFNTYGEQPGCFEKRPEYQTPQESSERIYEALDEIAGALHQRFPNLLLDYTFELWGEKHLIDYGLLRVADLDWMSNVGDWSEQDAGPLQVRTLLYQRGMAIPSYTMLIGNLQAEMPPTLEHVATEMGSGPVFLGDLRKQSAADAARYREWIERFNRLRESVSLSDSFFPLGNWRQPRADRWDGFARFSRSGEGLIVLFRNDSGVDSAQIKIPGYPDGSFTFKPWTSGASWTVEGKDLRKELTVRFSGEEKVEVIEVRRTQSDRAANNSVDMSSFRSIK